MAAYVIAAGTVTDAAAFAEYQAQLLALIARYDGHVLADGVPDVVEGLYRPDGATIIEFPSMTQARAWYSAPEHQHLRALRQRAAHGVIFFLDGFLRQEPGARP